MPQLREVRTSLEVGYREGAFPESFLHLRGKDARRIDSMPEFPYEDSQFEVVMMDGSVVSRNSVREAHRVLKPEGRLYFIVPEKTKKQGGFSLPDVYSVVREGFNIIEVQRPAWWSFGRRGRTITICAQKKNWRTLNNSYRPYV